MTTVTGPERELRERVLETARAMNALGVNRGKAGNVSARWRAAQGEGFLVTPSGMRYAEIDADDVVFVTLQGDAFGARKPSSEWRFHRDIYRTRREAGAIVHMHSPAATSLACTGRGIPAFHYMVAVAGGSDIRCAPYATFGTQALSDFALAALEGRKACLLANHGMIAFGASLSSALELAVEVEALAEMYGRALQLGGPVLLGDAEMKTVVAKFGEYGQPRAR